MIIKYSQTNKKEHGSMKIAEYKLNQNFSGALIEINGRHGKVKCLNEDRIYFIIEGTGSFIIDDKEEKISANDVIFIPRNMPYDIIGRIKFFMICSPGFNPKDDISME